LELLQEQKLEVLKVELCEPYLICDVEVDDLGGVLFDLLLLRELEVSLHGYRAELAEVRHRVF
jgi:hypothetical protein